MLNNRRNILIGFGGGLVVVALLVASVFVYSVENPSIAKRRVVQILETPQNFYGNTVTVEGKVGHVLGTRALTVDTPGVIGDQLLVISKESLEPVGGSGIQESIFSSTDPVRIVGQVREFNIQDVQEQLGVDLDDSIYKAWEGRPYIFVNTIHLEDK